jgi:DNA repair protein RadC
MRVYEASLQYTPTLWEVGFRTMDTPAKVIEYMKDLNEAYPFNEVFYVILLNTKTKPMGRVQITSGTLNSALVHPREVFRAAVLGGAHSIICLHNHPSGDPAPSSADLQITRQLSTASRAIEIPMIDHVILGRPECDPASRGYYSFREAGLL